ncbi:MAG: TonB-dependent receptor [Acidobacteria bacterium]|nr:TonB-dependent receptor [Acidobacteriota bacterium]
MALSSAPAAAQDGEITGRVTDETGAVLPGATVTLSGPDEVRVTQSDGNGNYAFPAVPAGAYSVTAALSGFSDANLQGIVVADRLVEAPPITLSIASFGDTVVVTASRTEVRVVDAPVTTSVVPAATLETTASSNVGDVLRSVPGVNVIQLSARDVQVTSRQSTGAVSNSQLVLVDGRSVYLDFFGLVLWDLLPANQGDIEQIEVVRGPASATWGANAMTGAVNIITKPPRQSVGTTVTMSGGWIDRDAGSTTGQGAGTMFGTNATVTRAPTDRLAYRISAGYFRSDAFPRPTGRIPVIDDPRVPGAAVGGAFYPLDGAGAFGTAFANRGTSQPKFDARVDQELSEGRISYSGGVAGTEGLVHSGVGPFDMQRGSYLGYAKVGYTRGDLRAQVFTNFLDGEAPNLLLPDPGTGQPVNLGFRSQTLDAEIGHSTFVGERNYLTYGGNVRRNDFDITIAPTGKDRVELGAYLQDEIFFDRFRLVLGGRVDKFGNLAKPVFSPRLAFMLKPGVDHSVTLSYNRAFRSPSMINNFMDMSIIQPVDLSPLAAFRPLLPVLLPPGLPPAVAQGAVQQLEQQLDQTTAQPFPLVVRAAGSDVPAGDQPRIGIKEESLTAYELSYTGTFGGRTTAGAAVYLNRRDDPISFVPLPPDADPYTAQNPPPGWLLPPQALTFMALAGVVLPRTAFTYVNLGPTQQVGAELWVDRRISRSASAWFNYSWQDEPRILDSDNPFLPTELSLPPTHRVNVGASLDGSRLLGNVSVSAASAAFWSDVLTPEFHGYSDGYTMVNGSFGMKWSDGAITTLVKVTNLFNQSIQQHIFGDILRRTVVGEVRFSL